MLKQSEQPPPSANFRHHGIEEVWRKATGKGALGTVDDPLQDEIFREGSDIALLVEEVVQLL